MRFLRIKNRKNFLLESVPVYNPYSRIYIPWWAEQKKRCIEGFWSIDSQEVNVDIRDINPDFPEESDSWRWIPPNTYFYANYGTILRNKRGTTSGAKLPMRPSLDDVEWEFGYNWLEARGFSGFEFDDEYSCNRHLLDEDLTDEDLKERCKDEDENIIPILYNNYFKKDGKRKTFVPAREYIRKTFNKPMGRPIYGNIPRNMMILGTRDGGKSYLVANQGIAHELIFDGMRYYDVNKDNITPTAELVVGASISDKSRDLMDKVKLTINNMPGTWRKGHTDEFPMAFFKHMSGSTGANKEWRHIYKKKIAGNWEDAGTDSKIKHRVFTTENPEAAAGGRPGTIVLEEVGLVPNLISIHSSNDAAQNDGGEKFGSTLYIGTAGNMEKIIEAEEVFNNPKTYDFLEFDNIWEEENHSIAWFIPATHMSRRFKDEQGNTKVDEALKHYEARRVKKSEGASKKALEGEMLNYPLKPSEMFMTKDLNKFPTNDIKIRIRDLLSPNNDELKNTYKGFMVLNNDGTAGFEEDSSLKPIREYPIRDKTTKLDGCIEIFSMPMRDEDGRVLPNIYGASLDPVDDDGNEKISASLQSTFVINFLTGEIVAEYTGRTKSVKDYYEQVRRLLLFYNAKILYENQKKGIYTHFDQKNSLYLLEDTPKQLKDVQTTKIVESGNKSKGVWANTEINHWGQQEILPNYLEAVAYGEESVMRLQKFKSLGALREMLYYDGTKKVNTDRISSLGLLMIYKELRFKRTSSASKKRPKKLANDPFFNRHESGGSGPFSKMNYQF